MSDYIEIDAIRDAGYQLIRETPSGKIIPVSRDELSDTIPAADVVERKRGEWVNDGDEYYQDIKCSACWQRKPILLGDFNFNFCPNCGADMRSEDMVARARQTIANWPNWKKEEHQKQERSGEDETD